MTTEERQLDELGDWQATFPRRTASEVFHMLSAERQRAEKAEKERDEARACVAEMRTLFEKINGFGKGDLSVGELSDYVNENCELALSTDCGKPLLARLERYQRAIGVVELFLDAPGNDALLADAKAACEALKES